MAKHTHKEYRIMKNHNGTYYAEKSHMKYPDDGTPIGHLVWEHFMELPDL